MRCGCRRYACPVIRADVRRLLVENRLEVAWVGFACLNLMAMLALITNNGPHGWETVHFHLIYVSFTLLYGYRMWRGKGTIAGITFVSLSLILGPYFGSNRKVSLTRYIWLRTLDCISAGTVASEP